ncbi:hypothetical protein CHARACLAT_019685 [Characodon lateralis]|uniref:Deleted in azoospermia-associated protein 2 n=1 Tax=Characodon lateralis TaxID=208331 RepID=A0ABU7E590_9TELE|nr:hypothetical protein [Characodon lateralis]
MQAPSHPQFVQTVPVPVALRPMPDAGYISSSGLFLPVQAGYVEGFAMPLQAGYVISLELLGLTCQRPSGLFLLKSCLEESTNTQPKDRSKVLPPFPPAPPATALQSGRCLMLWRKLNLGTIISRQKSLVI